MPVLLMTDIRPLGGAHAEVRALLDELVAASRAEDGCLGSDAYAGLDGERFLLTSSWRDEAAMRAHFRTPAYGRYADLVTPALAAPSRVDIHYVSQTVHALGDPSNEPGRLG
jgi:quinol monooxygenase YgiN